MAPYPGAAQRAPSPDLKLQERVQALRDMASQDAVPAIQKIVQYCRVGHEFQLPRKSSANGVGKLFTPPRFLTLRFQAPENDPVSEAAVVLAASCAAVPKEVWQGQQVVDLGCGLGFAGVTVAAMGAQVTLTDAPRFQSLALNSISLNADSIRSAQKPGSASFCPVNWRQPRESRLTCEALAGCSLAIASDPVRDEASMPGFIAVLQALFGLDGKPALSPNLDCVLIAHKHLPSFCVKGYACPDPNAPPTIVSAEEGERCFFRRSLEDAGLSVVKSDAWLKPPEAYAHPYVECWEVTRSLAA
eukprot:TRINITY_DN45536_c0_g1_i1.p1 TRINITY_DN45536_c0_g1~~TRINITY_DN45536_c0_g1_i1.p1  ORF type:complete len:302 (-),score=43.12 TRINITY_DN45536_c0_g1_i1:248-1153(-)